MAVMGMLVALSGVFWLVGELWHKKYGSTKAEVYLYAVLAVDTLLVGIQGITLGGSWWWVVVPAFIAVPLAVLVASQTWYIVKHTKDNHVNSTQA